MTIRAINLTPGSRARSPYNSFKVTLPRADFYGLAALQSCSAGTRMTLSGSYCKNITTDGYGCDLRLPISPVIVVADRLNGVTATIEGEDHLGRKVTGFASKTLANTMTGSQCYTVFSKITAVNITRVYVVGSGAAATMNVGLGFCYGGWDGTTAFPSTRRVANDDAVRRIPLPILPQASTDIMEVMPLGPATGGVFWVATHTKSTNLTYTATNVTSATAGDFAAVITGDVVYTADGYAGVATGAAAAGVITVTAWVRAGATGTPANWTGNANGSAGLQIVRLPYIAALGTTNAVGGCIPGVGMGGYAPTTTALVGVNASTASYGFLGDIINEPLEDMDFLVTYKPGTLF